MVEKLVAMEAKLLAVLTRGLEGINVSALCRELEISRQTLYKYRRRFEVEGPAGLVERSRRPHRSSQLIAEGLEDEIVRLRKTLPDERGAQTIAYHLARAGWRVPSVATIHRVLVRRGMVVPAPEKRPRSAWRRFEWPRPNDAWQIDATLWALADGREIWIMDVLDDHSRLYVAARVWATPTTTAAWDALAHGIHDWGLPARVMSDNGACFTTRRFSNSVGSFARNLAGLGIIHIRSRPGHPQTCGKLERAHKTTKQWLTRLPAAATPDELQAQLDAWRAFYNHDRPHRALTGATPIERWHATTPAQPGPPIRIPARASLHIVHRNGHIDWCRYQIGVGAAHAGQQLLVVARDDHVTLWGPTGRVRALTIDPTRRYQPTGRPPQHP